MSFDDWETYKLGDVTYWKSGGTPSKTNAKFWDGSIPWISAKTLTNVKISDSEITITDAGLQSGSRLAPVDSILLLVRGSGLFNDIPVGIVEKPVAFNQDIKAIEVDRGIITPYFLLYWILANKALLRSILEETGIGAGKFDTDILKKLEIKIPSFEIQSKLTDFARAIDDKIVLNRQMNQTLEEMARSVFREWFVNFNYPGADGVLEDGLPVGWRLKRIKELGTVVTGNTPSSNNPEYFGEEVPFITPSDFRNYNKLIIDAGRSLSSDGAKSLKNKVLPENSVIITCIGSDMGKVAINKVKCLTNQQINSIIVNWNVATADYLYYELIRNYDLLRNMATGGSTMPIINKSQFEDIQFVIPPLNLLKQFQSVVDPINEKLKEIISENRTLAMLRDSLLPKLMKGEISV